MAAYSNAYHIANGLQLDFTVEGADTANDALLGVSSSGQLTSFSSLPATRISAAGDLSESTSSVLTITGGTGAVLSGVTIQVKLATTGQSGYLSSTDWNTFNNKLGTTLADGKVLVGNGSNVATAVTLSGDFTITNAGVGAISANVIVNADISSSAAIAFTKMAAFVGTNLVTATDGSGFVTTVAGFTTTIAGFLTNISSDVQAQLDDKNVKILNLATSATAQAPGASENGYAIIWDNGNSEWTVGPVGGGGSVTGPGSSTANGLVTWNGTGGTSLLSSTVTLDGSGNLGALLSLTSKTVQLLDTDDSHDLILSAGSDLTADRTLSIVTGDAGRTVTLSGNPTLADWFDQSVKTTANPLFASATMSNAGGLHLLDSDESHDLVIVTSSDLTADRTLTLVPGDSNRTLTINASGTLYVTGGTDVSLADGGTGASLADPGADRILFWDDSGNAMTWLTVGNGLDLTGTTLTAGATLTGNLTINGGAGPYNYTIESINTLNLEGQTVNISASSSALLLNGNSSATLQSFSGTTLVTSANGTTIQTDDDTASHIVIKSGNNSSGNSGNVYLRRGTASGTRGHIMMDDIPTSDPGIPGAIYRTAGALMVSI